MKKCLRAIKHRDSYTTAITQVVQEYFDEVIYKPIIDLLASYDLDIKSNAKGEAVMNALKTGSIWYADGEFTGNFNAAISKELRNMGAKWNAGKSCFTLPIHALPIDVRAAAAVSLNRSIALHDKVKDLLTAIQTNAVAAVVGLELAGTVEKIAASLHEQFAKSVDGIESIELSAVFTEATAQQMREELTENLELDIKNFVQEDIPKLREEVQANAFVGYRTDRLAEIIEARYGVTKRKAAFLADQETGLLVSKYRMHRALEIGARTYTWSTSGDERVRPDHRDLNNKVFSWDSPPITNKRTGMRNNPGEDYRCRCVALPIIEIPE